jgi:hypothetical protein
MAGSSSISVVGLCTIGLRAVGLCTITISFTDRTFT